MCPPCAHKALTMCLNRSGVGNQRPGNRLGRQRWAGGALDYAPMLCPVCAHYALQVPLGESAWSTMHPRLRLL